MSLLLNNNIKIKKSNFNDKNCCKAAVKHNTRGSAYRNIEKNIPVCIVIETKNNVSKKNAYSQCSKTIIEGSDYCHLHLEMKNVLNRKNFELDIFPSDLSDKSKSIATLNDDYFENMGKRGAKKKNCDNTYTFDNINNPVLLVLNHKDPKKATELLIYASQILKGNNIPNEIIKEENKKESNLNSLISMINSLDIKKEDSISSDNEEDSSEEILSDNESEDGVPCIEIYTNTRKLLWYNVDNNTVYEPEGEDGGEEIGILKEISIEYHTITYKDKFYTVLIEINDKKYGKIFCCVLSDKLFDKKFKNIGNRIKLKNNEYQMNFLNDKLRI